MTDHIYTLRDVSWLQFNFRVLQEAANPEVPLYERIKFLAIYSSNLDEFYRVRVAALRSFGQLKKSTRKIMEIRPKKELKLIRSLVETQMQKFGEIWQQILVELTENGVLLINDKDFNEDHKYFAKQFFNEKLKNKFKIYKLRKKDNLPFLKNKGLYLVVTFQSKEEAIALLEIPTDKVSRFVELGEVEGKHYLTFIDDIIRFNLPELFPGTKIKGSWAVKISRDAEIYIDDEFSGNLLEKIKKGIEKRNIGLPTRFLYDAKMPQPLLNQLKAFFNLSKYDLVPGARYHNFNDFFGFPNPLKKPSWSYPEFPPLPHRELENEASIIEAMEQKDYILHFPYHQFHYVPKFIDEATNDEDVDCIKITLYRVAEDSSVAKSLMRALKKGKKVVVFIEAKARFDEASNLYWGDRLADAGAEVIYSFPGIKVHTKLLLVRKKVKGEKKYYAYIGTGNFNEKTAKIYCDHALLTSDARITNEISQVFDLLQRKVIIPQTKHVLISPFTTRSGFVNMIDKEIAAAKAGKVAYMFLKMNSLEDTIMIQKLYEASQAEVKIRLIIRGICGLVPGVKGQSENIQAISIIDRFLEHARVYIFGNEGNELMYLSSADWMTRNLDKRVEVAVPVLDKSIREELRWNMELQWADNTQARKIDVFDNNTFIGRTADEEPVRAQSDFYEKIKASAESPLPSDTLADHQND